MHHTPIPVNLGVTEDIEFRIGEEESEALVAGVKGSGKAMIGDIAIGTCMTAKLNGEPKDFSITPFGTEKQLIDGTAVWKWKVTSLRSGRRSLRLLSTIRIKVPSNEEERDYRTLDKKIEIPVDRSAELVQFLATNGNWLWPAIFGGVAPGRV